MFIHICGMFDLQLTNAYRLKHYLINSTVSYFLRWSLILAWIYLVYMSYTEEVRWPPSSLVFCVHLVLQFTREACTLYFLFLFGIYIYNCYSLRLSGPKPWLEIKFVHYLIKHQSQGGLAPVTEFARLIFFFTVNVLPFLSGQYIDGKKKISGVNPCAPISFYWPLVLLIGITAITSVGRKWYVCSIHYTYTPRISIFVH